MMLYRVLPWVPAAVAGAAGHPRFAPDRQGAGRVDNPEHYRVLYLADHPAGAVAEAFGDLSAWTSSMLRGAPSLPGSRRALATYELPDSQRICDLDDAARLLELRLCSSEVVTRDRSVTQAWSLRLWQQASWAGVRWWSYRDPRWGALALWRADLLVVDTVVPLTMDHPDLRAAADVLSRLLPPREIA